MLNVSGWKVSGVSELNQDAFLRDETMKRAVVRSLDIIGEASTKIPVDQKLRWNEIPWKNMAGMRDRLPQRGAA